MGLAVCTVTDDPKMVRTQFAPNRSGNERINGTGGLDGHHGICPLMFKGWLDLEHSEHHGLHPLIVPVQPRRRRRRLLGSTSFRVRLICVDPF